jgi:hypothetical protein
MDAEIIHSPAIFSTASEAPDIAYHDKGRQVLAMLS